MKHLMILLTGTLASAMAAAQSTDSTTRQAAASFRDSRQAASHQKIWKTQLYGPMLFIDPDTHEAWANEPDSAGTLKLQDGVYHGVYPKELMIANTAVNWQGKRWSMMMWPLPGDKTYQRTLMLHESFHRVQKALGFHDDSPTLPHLNSMDGRIYFLLELQALKAALGKPVNKRKADLLNALLFREKRRLLFPKTFADERLLEMNEGLAEYTGVVLGRPRDSVKLYLQGEADNAANRPSLLRSAAYFTGPLYGYLLYEKAPGWSLKARAADGFPELLAKYYSLSIKGLTVDKLVAKAVSLYNGDAIIASEKEKEAMHQKLIAGYTETFSHKPVLQINLVKMNIVFNPNTLVDLGALGTVYPTGAITDEWGHLEVKANGLLLRDWKVATVPVGSALSPNAKSYEGDGWKLTLNDGWQILKNDELHYRLAKR